MMIRVKLVIIKIAGRNVSEVMKPASDGYDQLWPPPANGWPDSSRQLRSGGGH